MGLLTALLCSVAFVAAVRASTRVIRGTVYNSFDGKVVKHYTVDHLPPPWVVRDRHIVYIDPGRPDPPDDDGKPCCTVIRERWWEAAWRWLTH